MSCWAPRRVWLILVAATFVSLLLSTDAVAGSWREIASCCVLAVALWKVRLVGMAFMDLRDAPTALRRLFEGYTVVIGLVLTGLYLAGSG